MSSVILLCSSRSDGNTRKVCEYISTTTNTPIFDFNDYKIGFYDYDHLNQGDDYFKLVETLLEYETLIFASPVYWYSMSAQMKTFFDRITDLLKIKKDLGRQLRGKNMKVLCCSSDSQEYPAFWDPFIKSSEYLGMHYLGHVHTWLIENKIPEVVKKKLSKSFI